ncbi:hypothetical protein J45TS6_11370 [Paenibacillus sp. J45TS6]|nr:hypothetical protein J45TS6_11370 [Paenibacillus sp. J45TS6]
MRDPNVNDDHDILFIDLCSDPEGNECNCTQCRDEKQHVAYFRAGSRVPIVKVRFFTETSRPQLGDHAHDYQTK